MSSQEMTFDLLDSGLVNLGRVSINSLDNEIYSGKFSPNNRFERYKAMFLEYELLVESQQFSAVDEMELRIEGMGFLVSSGNHEGAARAIFDLQIMRDGISFRMMPMNPGLNANSMSIDN